MSECNHAVVGSCEKCERCGVCGRAKGRGYGQCSAPDSSDYTVSLQCMSIALRKAQDDVKAAEERGQAKERMLRDGTGGEKDLNLEKYAAAIRAGDDPAAVLRYALAAAEERGRRSGLEERDGLRALLAEVRSWILAADRNHLGRRELLARIDAALAPRDSAPAIPSVASQGCPECSKPQPGDLGMGSIEARQLRCPHKPRGSGKET